MNNPNSFPHEQLEQASPQHQELLDGRYEMAVHQADHEMRQDLNIDRYVRPAVAITKVENSGFGHDYGVLQSKDLVGFDAIGVKPEVILEATGNDGIGNDELITTYTLGSEELHINRYRDGVNLVLRDHAASPAIGDAKPSVALQEKVAARYSSIPGYKALAEASELWSNQEELPPVVVTQSFKADEDPLGKLAFLQDIGMTSGMATMNSLHEGKSIEEVSADIEGILSNGVTLSEDEDRKVYSWGNVVRKDLIVDSEGNYTLSLTKQPGEAYAESANQLVEAKAMPFLETQCAKELCDTLDKAGLMFSPKFQAELMRTAGEADRFGSVFTQMTREVAKWVGKPDRVMISKLFIPKDPRFDAKAVANGYTDGVIYDFNRRPKDEATATEQAARQLWRSAATERDDFESESAAALVGLVDGVLSREESGSYDTDLPVTKEWVRMTDGSCFDVTYYYVSGRTKPFAAENGVMMREKTYGKHTFLNEEPIMFNGVALPKGALFTKNKDGWAFMRLTPFSFDGKSDQMAFGAEIEKAERVDQRIKGAAGAISLRYV